MPKGIYKRTINKGWFKVENLANPNRAKNLTHKWSKGIKIRLGIKHTEETKRKIALGMIGKNIGEKSGHWIKDRTMVKIGDRKSNDPLQKEWSMGVKKRDKWKCRINNKDCDGKVVAHHILSWREFPGLRYNIKNGITLCHFHHPKKRVEEKHLIPFFQGLVIPIQI